MQQGIFTDGVNKACHEVGAVNGSGKPWSYVNFFPEPIRAKKWRQLDNKEKQYRTKVWDVHTAAHKATGAAALADGTGYLRRARIEGTRSGELAQWMQPKETSTSFYYYNGGLLGKS